MVSPIPPVSWAQAVFESALGEWMRGTLRAMPVMEAVHIVASCMTFGTVLFVDLRLLGIPHTRTPVQAVLRGVLPWTWIAFAVSASTGICMFVANATTYVGNRAFLLKMGALVVAGINMGTFHGLTQRSLTQWNIDAPPPTAARLNAVLSISLWAAMVILGRWIGFTKGYDFTVPEAFDLGTQFNLH